jgi:putative acetyltransferase
MTNTAMPQSGIEIVEFQAKYARAFRDLNYAWLEQFFSVEPYDRIVLNDPHSEIIRRGGYILFALRGHEVVGTCALLKHTEKKYELAKMAVSEEVRGQGIGKRLVVAAVEKARSIGADTLVLATSDQLVAANHLYLSSGFQHADPSLIGPLPYKRKSIVMVMTL